MLIIIGSKILTNFNEECHHVEQLLNIDAAVAILVKQVEHLHNIAMSRRTMMLIVRTMMTMTTMTMMMTWPRLSSVLPSQKR